MVYERAGDWPDDRREVSRRQPVQGVALPEDITIVPNRAGDNDRDRVANALAKAHAEGFIGAEETETRISHAMKARSRNELAQLVADLPAPPARKTKNTTFMERRMKKKHANGLMQMGLLMLGFIVGIVPWPLLVPAPHEPTWHFALGASATITGVMMIIAAIVWAVSVWD